MTPAGVLVLGIDPGLGKTGYGLVEMQAQGERLVDAGLLRTTRSHVLERRLAELRAGLEELFTEFTPDVMVVEELFVHYKHVKTAIIMGHARGVLLLSAGERDVPIVHYAATRIKQSLTGHGRASKLQMQRVVQQLLQLPGLPEPNDVADALGAALCHIRVMRQGG